MQESSASLVGVGKAMRDAPDTPDLSSSADHAMSQSDAHGRGVQPSGRTGSSARTRHRSHLDDERANFLIRYVREFAPFVVRRAFGSWIETVDGERILDFASGQICSTIGHNHPAVASGLERAAREGIHLNSKMLSLPLLELAARVAELLPEPLSKAIFLNTGSEANEVALKMARMATGRFEVAGLARSFHGVLTGIGSLTFLRSHAGYGPLLAGAFALPAPTRTDARSDTATAAVTARVSRPASSYSITNPLDNWLHSLSSRSRPREA